MEGGPTYSTAMSRTIGPGAWARSGVSAAKAAKNTTKCRRNLMVGGRPGEITKRPAELAVHGGMTGKGQATFSKRQLEGRRPNKAMLAKVKSVQGRCDHLDLLLVQSGENRKGDAFMRGALCLGKVSVAAAEINKEFLPVQRNSVVDGMADLFLLEMAQQFVAPIGTDHVLMPGMMIFKAGIN